MSIVVPNESVTKVNQPPKLWSITKVQQPLKLISEQSYDQPPQLISHQRVVQARAGFSPPHLHSHTRVQKYRHICCSKLQNIIFKIARLISCTYCTCICLYTSSQYQAANVNQPLERGTGKRRLFASLAQQHRSAELSYRHICCSKWENIILSNFQVNESFPKYFGFF
jgi:hypothetical protein